MIVQGGNTFLAQQGHQGKSPKSESETNDFQDFLVGAGKKKTHLEKSNRKSFAPKRKKEQEAYEENQSVAKRRERPIKKEEASAKRREVRSVDNGQKQANPEKVQTRSNQGINKKFAENAQEDAQLADSLNLSGVDENTLEKNQQLLEANENSFENMMAQMKMQAASKKGASGIGQGMEAKIGAMANMKNGSIKIGEMDLSQGGETLSLSGASGLEGMKTLSQEGGESASDSATSQLESLFSQLMEQDGSVVGEDGVTFADSMGKAEGGQSEKIENMQSIIKQARAFVDDGGGSMEIHLQPEGLGKVHLKVAVQDGQVNVEMLADTLAAKKALEEGLVDIKGALESQKLLVETLKVEMSPDYQKDFSDLANHMQEQANRDFAEQFLGQFRQERDEKLGGMFDSFRSFQPGPKEPELALSRNPYAEQGKGRSVNLVA